ncbi:phosphotransferase [Paenibacillus silviterrae]|uniref:phosphotransferase n=1 Tax=Paenibacillus silviterrae TaxID=3242194 RepID=UPI00254280B1|nr:phosphotransferase [Paenibacillus chinjuensis]
MADKECLTEWDDILEHYFPCGQWEVLAWQGKGMNNTTRFIKSDNEHYVLRIYETHQDEHKVLYEHAVLLELGKLDLSFRTPAPVRTQGGQTVLRTKNGKLAALFRYIEGQNPALQSAVQLNALGKAAADLTIGLSKVHLALESVYRPYYELENTHPLCSMAAVLDFCSNPTEAFVSKAALLEGIGRHIHRLQQKLSQLRHLPHQLIHGDLNASNVLMDSEDRIAAVLDFEFVTRDLRAMELAVCLSDLIRFEPQQDPKLVWDKVDALLTGYGDSLLLSADEVEAVPLLLLLRRLDVFIHFLGRYWDGVDEAEVVAQQIQSAYAMTQWLDRNESKLLDLLKRRIFPAG